MRQCVVNAVLLAGIQNVATAIPLRTQIWGLLGTTGPAYIGYGVIGFLFAVLWIPAEVGWFSAVLVLAPLFVARWAFAQYGDELQAHERTLRALVTAVETKEPHNAGHSERVAQLSEWMAEAMLLGHKEIQDIRTAGMLHDVGKVAMPTRLLGSRQPHTDDDLVRMAGHALGGVELVKDVDFLSGSVDGIAHHHERFDGRGYPDGLAGDAIPLAARIVAVADAFECLTSAHSYRPALSAEDALDVVRGQAATQFDPQVVELLVKALSRHEWTVTDRTPDELASAGVALDHDEPEVSDHIAFTDRLRTQDHRSGRRPAPRERGGALMLEGLRRIDLRVAIGLLAGACVVMSLWRSRALRRRPARRRPGGDAALPRGDRPRRDGSAHHPHRPGDRADVDRRRPGPAFTPLTAAVSRRSPRPSSWPRSRWAWWLGLLILRLVSGSAHWGGTRGPPARCRQRRGALPFGRLRRRHPDRVAGRVACPPLARRDRHAAGRHGGHGRRPLPRGGRAGRARPRAAAAVGRRRAPLQRWRWPPR